MAKRLADTMGLAGAERKKFISSVLAFRAEAAFAGTDVGDARDGANAPSRLENELYDVIGDIYHLAILEMTFTDDFRSDPRVIARELGISTLEAKVAIGRLLATRLLEKRDGRLAATNRSTTTKDKSRTSMALRRNQQQILEKALHSLLHDDYAVRSMAGITMAIDPQKIPLARDMIQRFMDELANVLGSGRKSTVYQLGVSLYPLQRKRGASCAK